MHPETDVNFTLVNLTQPEECSDLLNLYPKKGREMEPIIINYFPSEGTSGVNEPKTLCADRAWEGETGASFTVAAGLQQSMFHRMTHTLTLKVSQAPLRL